MTEIRQVTPQTPETVPGFETLKLTAFRVLMAAAETILFLILIGMHRLVDIGLDWILLPDFPVCVSFAKIVFGVAFSLAYLALALNIIVIFWQGIVEHFRGK